MFQPKVFREERTLFMHDMIKNNPFGTLVSMQDGQLIADHLPFVLHRDLSDQGVLRSHIAKGNKIEKHLTPFAPILVIFQGMHHYISPSWYPSKIEHEKVVPTWNYMTVHARGALRFFHEDDWKLSHLNALTNQQEKNRQNPWQVSDAPSDFIAVQLKGLIGIEIDIKSLQGTWKLSQNKTQQDRQGVIKGLRNEHSEVASSICRWMEINESK
ncbi:FMN-binding negative transcriptional regulator [Algicola sagamiensis]|uniref:FMN-binding negative transcriptional regulator n=1 Tax=Algicola sagamiensis TaxID=163869 RepID=UPI00036B0730|nr:FMN-binding negative transcriptional regulator [Algicola sagamiensis]